MRRWGDEPGIFSSDLSSDVEGMASSASKALAILEVVASSDGGVVRVSDVANAVGIPKSTTHRLLAILGDRGFVDRSGSRYRVGGRFFELSESSRLSAHGALRDVAAPTLEWLFDQVGVTVHLGVLDGAEVVYIEKITGRGGCRIPSRIGGRMPALTTAIGKALVAFAGPEAGEALLGRAMPRLTPYSIVVPDVMRAQLAEIRSTRIARECEESRLGFHCVAAPVLRRGRAVTAISLAAPVSSGAFTSRQTKALAEAAVRTSIALAHEA